MSNAPPSYTAATGQNDNSKATPNIAVQDFSSGPNPSTTSHPQQQQHQGGGGGSHLGPHGTRNDDADDDDTDDEHDDARSRRSWVSQDEEMRELPQGWVRCFDDKTHHHFYAEEATGKTQWLHPYDDPVFLSSLPDTHPANPNSESARAARSKADQLHAQAQAAMKQHQEETGERDTDLNGKNGKEKRKFFGRMEDKILGSTPEERKVKKAKKREEERKAQEAYYARRKALMEKMQKDPRYQGYYSQDPFSPYNAPMQPYNRSPYGGYYPRYGYGGGYGYGYPGYYGGGYGGAGLGLGGGLLGGMLLGGLLF